MDQLPSNSFDLIICVQVLNELNEETLMHLLKQFGRIAKENCVLYIRDNELGYTPGHGIRVGRLLPKYGFELLFRYNGLDAGIEGKPRVWAYTGVEKSTAHLSLKYRLMTACSYCGGEGRLRSLRKSVMATIRDWGLPI
jgi:hypothetical protein